MSSLAKVLILHQLIILLLPNIASGSVPKFFIMDEKIDTVNSSNVTACKVKFSQSALKFILELMSDKITHVIDLHIWIESVNKTKNKTRVLTGIKWANEIGRTLITLIGQVENSFIYRRMLLPYTGTMTAGIYAVNIFVAEETMRRCFSSGDNTSDHAIFFLLMHQLYHINGRKTDYKLCLPHTDINQVREYNCCTIAGPHDSSICSDYFSGVTKTFDRLVITTVILVCFIVTALILKQLGNLREDDTHFRISNCPMSLSSILYSVFIEEHGPLQSAGRRLIFAVIVLVVTLPEQGALLWVYISVMLLWVIILFTKVISYHNFFFNFDEDPIEILTYPFNIIKWWSIAVKKWPCLSGTCSNIHLMTEESPLLNEDNNQETSRGLQSIGTEDGSKWKKKDCNPFFSPLLYLFYFMILIVLYCIIIIPFSCFRSIIELVGYNLLAIYRSSTSEMFYVLHTSSIRLKLCFITFVILPFFYLSATLTAMSIYTLFQQAFYFTIGVFLNGEIYSPYILPLCTILFYSWTKWRSSVETKYLVLLTTLYKVCMENDKNTSQSPPSPIEKDKEGEPIISKKIYNSVREKMLPYDRILFQYFQGVFFIVLFAYVLYILMSLAQASGISGPVQVISTISAASIPFIFDSVWKKNSDEQKEADSIALKSKLKRILPLLYLNDMRTEIENL